MSAINWKVLDGIIVANFTDAEIQDDARIQQIGQELMELASEAGKIESRKILLNFQGVEFMASGMFGKLVLFNKKALMSGVALRLCNISRDVNEVFKITRLDKLFKIIDDDPGTAGSLARLIQPPDTDGGRATPEGPADDVE